MRRTFPRALGFLAFLACAVVLPGCPSGGDDDDDDAPQGPQLASVSPDAGLIETVFTVTGLRFGDTQGLSELRVGGIDAQVQSWSDTSITATIPEDAFPGAREVVVETTEGVSNALTFRVRLPRAVYVISDNTVPSVVRAYSADATGTLAILNSSLTVSTQANDFGGATNMLHLHAGTRRLYAGGRDSVAIFDIDPRTGALTHASGSPKTVGVNTDNVYGVAASAAGDVFWATEYSDCLIHAYSATPPFTEVSGSPYGTADVTGGCDVLLLSRSGSWAYQNNEATGTVSAFTVAANGALSELAGSPLVLPDLVYSISADPLRDRFYAASLTSGAIFVLDVNDATGEISENAALRVALADGDGTATDGRRVFATTYAGGGIHVFDLNPSTGALSTVSGSPFFASYTGLSALAVSSDGSLVYTTDATAPEVRGFSVAGDGSLTELSGSPFANVPGSQASTIVITF